MAQGPHGKAGMSLADKLKKHKPDADFVKKVEKASEPEKKTAKLPALKTTEQKNGAGPATETPGQEQGATAAVSEFKSSFYTTYEIDEDLNYLVQKMNRENRSQGIKERISKKRVILEGLREMFKKNGIPEKNIDNYLSGGAVNNG